MQLLEGRLILSPTDLTGFLACEHLTHLERRAAQGEFPRPKRADAELDILHERGRQHEVAHLAGIREAGRTVAEVTLPDHYTLAELEAAAAETLRLMQGGAAVIYQAVFFDGRWLGLADFVERVETPSDLGAWSYEVTDTKLARKAKVPAILQLCAYSDHVARLQGLEPERVHLELGSGARESFAVRDFRSYYRLTKARFEASVTGEAPAEITPMLLPRHLRPGSIAPAPETYPEPVDHCGVCRWLEVCTAQRTRDDHLSLVAGMRRDWIRKLRAAGVPTVMALGEMTADRAVDGIQAKMLARVREQARMQLAQRATKVVSSDVLEPEPGYGLALLPEPSPGDLFFDMEGDPFAGVEGSGLEYLWGVLDAGNDWHAFWGHDAAGEKAAFEATVDLIMSRLAFDPAMHVYHYADYERNRLRTMAGRYGTREAEVDALLRGEVLVDLYRVVKHGIRVSQDSYSLKKLEPLYMTARNAAIAEAGSSIVAYENWLASGDQQLLDDIEAYNRDDCVSTLKLRDWLETQRAYAMLKFDVDIVRPEPKEAAPSAELSKVEAETADLVAALTADVPETSGDRSGEQAARALLADLLGWHRRELRSAWWTYFDRQKRTPDELVDDRESIGGLEFVADLGPTETGKSVINRYRFPPQENRVRVGDKPEDPATKSGAGTVLMIDNNAGLIELSRARSSTKPHPRALVPGSPYDTKEQRRSLARMAEAVVAGGVETPTHRAGLSLLQRLPPAVAGVSSGAPLAGAGEEQLGAAVRLGLGLSASYLPIQGPPGSGKTWTAARMIVALTDAGKPVGVTATSHRVIGNVLDAICRFCDESGRKPPRIVQKAAEGEGCARDEVECVSSNAAVDERVAAGDVDIVAGTGWLFAREELRARLDVLFIDEAGQMSLADALAVSQTATNLVLLGDPQQLAQPSQGQHPAGAGVSSLEHALERAATVPPERGLFLATSHRMHPDICEFISEIAYEGRLHSEPGCERQRILGDGPLSGTGLRYLAVEAAGNRTSAPEEVDVVDRRLRALLGQRWVDRDGVERTLTLEDILVVAPYNAQVARLTERLPEGARVGTVDKFQGQEAAVVFYSMASSSPDDMPRGLEFLFSLNRLNVAISRARCLAVLVASPALLGIRCRSVRQMRLNSALIRIAEVGPMVPAAEGVPLEAMAGRG
jgi:predicted RecB family nuclease